MKTLKTRLAAAAVVAALASAFISAVADPADNSRRDEPALMQPVKSVFDHYLKIQAELCKDSLKGINEQGSAIAQAVRTDGMKMLSNEVAKEADALAKAKDIGAAREAFKPLSASLIKYLADNKAGRGDYHEVYCPMAKASWLQSEKDVRNPYMGKDMLTCGEFKN